MSKRTKYTLNDMPNSKIAYLIDEWVHNKKYRDILRLICIDGLTYEQTAETVDMSVNQIKNIARITIPILYEKSQG